MVRNLTKFKKFFFFFFISIPKCIELNSESDSRWVLGLSLGPDPRLNETQAKMSAYRKSYARETDKG